MRKFRAAKVSGLLSAVVVGGLCALLISAPRSADAVPSFSRQTGFACSSCHTNPPELTPLGRAFKLNGYTMQGLKAITSPADKNKSGLSLLSVLPLSAQIEISDTGLNKRSRPRRIGAFRCRKTRRYFWRDRTRATWAGSSK